jgi:FKBP-type peptidyl-prolyl cis-trans isomerase FkpA
MMTKPCYITKGWRYSHPLAFEQYRRSVILISIVVLFSLVWLDNITGYEFGFFIFYFIPVAIAVAIQKMSFKERNSMRRIIIPTIISLLAATSFAAETVTAEIQEPVTTKSGLQYTSLREGSGAIPKPTDTVIVNYRGTLLNNREFDSSYKSGRPAEFQLNNVIKCWTEGLQMMKVGGKAKLSCPSNLAYGEEGVPGSIPRNAPLKFEVELIDIK